MGFEIKRSCPPKTAKYMRKMFEDKGMVEVTDQKEAKRLEAEGKMTFIDHTKSVGENNSNKTKQH